MKKMKLRVEEAGSLTFYCMYTESALLSGSFRLGLRVQSQQKFTTFFEELQTSLIKTKMKTSFQCFFSKLQVKKGILGIGKPPI